MADQQTIRSRADALIAELTPAEKAGQLTQYFFFGGEQSTAVESAVARGEVGSLLFVTDPAETNRLQRLAVEGNRFGIPALFGFDVIHGLRTILPVPIALAASWDPATIERGQAVAAREARAVGIHWTFAPMVDIARDPRWGRIIEGAGEDPFLGAAVAAAQVRGFQGAGVDDPERVIAGPKHFAGYGAALGGRDYDEADLSDSELHNVYFPPFAAALEAGAGNVMTAYMDLNGIPATGNRWLFTDVLRGAFGFEGFVVSDANAVRNLVTHGFARDLADAAARALNAGADMEMAIADPAYAHLPEALERGDIDEATLDASVRRVLEAKLAARPLRGAVRRRGARAGGAGRPRAPRGRADRGGAVGGAAAQRGRAAAAGPGDLDRGDRPARGLPPRHARPVGASTIDLDETVTVLEGIIGRAGDVVVTRPASRPAQRVFPSMFDMFGDNAPEDPEGFDDEAEFARAVELARAADVAVVVVGEWQNMIGEAASRSSLELPGRQLELLQAVAATGTPVVLLVMNGRPLDLRWAAEHVPAILDIWYPGTQGGEAVANLLFGDVSPGGKLPFTWPRTVGQVPMVYSHTISHEPEKQGRRYWDEESTPLFPFGHGLSYSRFAYSNLADRRVRRRVGRRHTTRARATADEVVQLYIHQRHGTASRPVRELKGFERVTLAAGETRTVRFTLGPAELRYWNAAARDWVLDASTFDVWVGGDSTAELTATFTR